MTAKSNKRPLISFQEVARHNRREDCWCIIHGGVYRLDPFLDEHPGGVGPILKHAGGDATAAFDPVHPRDVIDRYLDPELYLGNVDPATMPVAPADREGGPAALPSSTAGTAASGSEGSATVSVSQPTAYMPPPLGQILNLWDFEEVAQRVLRKESWAYYSSAADDEVTLQGASPRALSSSPISSDSIPVLRLRPTWSEDILANLSSNRATTRARMRLENHLAFGRLLLKPRVLVDVKEVDLTTTLLGCPSALPFYITACALGKLGHPEGEVCLTRAAGSRSILQMMPTLSSCSMDEMVRAKRPDQPHWFQLYVNSSRAITRRLVEQAERMGAQALFITVDAPSLGRRERDMRVKFVDEAPDVQRRDPEQRPEHVDREHGVAKAISSFIDPSLSWADLPWFRSITRMPIALKGIQCGEDAVLAARAGMRAIVISNHGGRQLDTCRAPMDILPEVVSALKREGLFGSLEIYVDGGVRRGTDIFKALALGANGVGIGRPFLYAMSGYGTAGVERAIDLLRDEFAMVMRLMGTRTVREIHESYVCRASDYGCGAASWKAHL